MAYISVDIDIEDYISDISTEVLIEELGTRIDCPAQIMASIDREEDLNTRSKHLIRDTIIEVLNLHSSATIEDIQEAVKENYYK